MRAQRGFILVNALVLVGALAAAAAVLLIRAEMSVQRQAAWQGAAQIDAYLDAFEALAITVLEADPAGGRTPRPKAGRSRLSPPIWTAVPSPEQLKICKGVLT